MYSVYLHSYSVTDYPDGVMYTANSTITVSPSGRIIIKIQGLYSGLHFLKTPCLFVLCYLRPPGYSNSWDNGCEYRASHCNAIPDVAGLALIT
ncbi:hypothetical protein GDO81_028005 [Engystomops pustulosus]|uniref:Uncharacterized protein n=1 Tax=Engystomops pustulosus TaxID=76066 RepID=A0AAV6YEI0_ENGPU|nr:hypothetical protein GDO81_028005 [Engystomops pustulosus]